MHILSKNNLAGLNSIEPKFQGIIDEFGLPDNWSRPQGFQTLCMIILEQQVSLESAKSAWNKLINRLEKVDPESILSLDQIEMKACYVSRQKSTYLHALSNAVLNGLLDLEAMDAMIPQEVEKELVQIKGIGPWTAQVYLIFALRSPDIYPRGDVALNNAVRSIWPVDSIDQIYSLSESWSPYRTTASFLLWHDYLCKRGRIWKG